MESFAIIDGRRRPEKTEKVKVGEEEDESMSVKKIATYHQLSSHVMFILY